LSCTITVDGACSPWKKMAVGYVMRNSDGYIVDKGHRDLMGRGSNNVAEYVAVITACDIARKHKEVNPIIYTDSQLVLKQLRGDYGVKNAQLKNLRRAAVRELRSVKAVVRWHSREDGDGPLADRLASYRYKEVLNAGNDSKIQQSGTGEDDNRPSPQTAGSEAVGSAKAHTVEISA